MLFQDKREVELVWNGKTREVSTAVLPFQSLEHVDEPREEKGEPQEQLFDLRGRQLKGWTNKLIWGDNKLILSSLKSGALRQQIEAAGGLKLIYIDPPFDVGADFSMDIEIGGRRSKGAQPPRADRLPRHLGPWRGFVHRDALRTPDFDARPYGTVTEASTSTWEPPSRTRLKRCFAKCSGRPDQAPRSAGNE